MKFKFKGRVAAVVQQVMKMVHDRKLVDHVVASLTEANNLKETGQIIQKAFEDTRSSWIDPVIAVACKKGCAYCCHLNVDLLAGEEIVIRDYVKDVFSKEQINEIKQKAMIRYQESEGKDVEERQDIKGPCAFLADDNTCRIYDVRPVSCRGFYSVMLERCEEGFTKQGVQNAFWADPKKAKEDIELAVTLIDLNRGDMKMPRSMEQFIMKKL
jgi:Fe-S-cluster containining protein